MNTKNIPLYEVNIDFDEASEAWKSNKKYIGNGCYKYITNNSTQNSNTQQNSNTTNKNKRCKQQTNTGKRCKRDSQIDCEYCFQHNKLI